MSLQCFHVPLSKDCIKMNPMSVLCMALVQVAHIVEPQVVKHYYQIPKSRLVFIQEVL